MLNIIYDQIPLLQAYTLGSNPFPARNTDRPRPLLLWLCAVWANKAFSGPRAVGEEGEAKLLNSSLPYYISGQTQ